MIYGGGGKVATTIGIWKSQSQCAAWPGVYDVARALVGHWGVGRLRKLQMLLFLSPDCLLSQESSDAWLAGLHD